MSTKIKVKTPIVEMDGDEMTRVIWAKIKEQLILPYVDVDLKYYDLHVSNRDKTEDRVTVEAAEAIKQYGVGVKCATITPNADRVKEYDLKKQWASPNGTIRSILDGTVFRTPIMMRNIPPAVKSWRKPITIARHAYGDVYKNVEMRIPGKGRVDLVYTDENGKEQQRETVHEFKGAGIVRGVHNLDKSIYSFARACFAYGLAEKRDVWFATKDTISKIYHGRFRDIWHEVFENEYREKFKSAGIEYFYTLIDDMVARQIKGEGGMIWSCLNYDGDVQSDMLGSGFGSLGLMKSVLVSPDGHYEYEAAHGTVTRHYYKHLKGEETSTNSIASIFAWTGALRRRGLMDDTFDVVNFAAKLEHSVVELVEHGQMTKDLVSLTTTPNPRVLNTFQFLSAIEANLREKLGR